MWVYTIYCMLRICFPISWAEYILFEIKSQVKDFQLGIVRETKTTKQFKIKRYLWKAWVPI